MTREKGRYVKIVGGGLVGCEVAYILARYGFCVHIFDKKQPLMCHIERRIALKNELDAELSAFDSPTYLLAKRLGVNVENIDGEFVDMVRDKLKTFSNLSFVDAEIDELNYNELTLLCTGNNTTKNLIRNLSKFVGENKVNFFHPAPIKVSYIDQKNLHYDGENLYHINLNENDFGLLVENLKKYRKRYDSDDYVNEISIEKRAENNSLRTYLRPIYTQNEKPFASIRLKKYEGDYELVDFYTALNNAEQEKILKGIPALQNAVITSFGKIYLRTHLKSSTCIDRFLKIKNHENIFVGGGFLGVGGVYENLLVANYIAHNIMRELNGKNLFESPKNTALGLIVEKLLKKSCLNDMLLSLNYDIIGKDELNFDSGEILKFKENCHGKFLQN